MNIKSAVKAAGKAVVNYLASPPARKLEIALLSAAGVAALDAVKTALGWH